MNSIYTLARLLSVASLFSLPLVAFGQVSQHGAAYDFKVKVRQGATLNYVITTKTNLPTSSTIPKSGGKTHLQSISLVTPVKGAVTSVQHQQIALNFTLGPSTLNGKPQGEPRSFPVTVDNHGRPVGAPAPGLENLLNNLPDKPLKVGDSYSIKQSVTFQGIPVTLSTSFRLRGVTNVSGQRCADFAMTVAGSGSLPAGQSGSAPFQIKGTGSMQVNMADGLLQHLSGDANLMSAGTTQQPMLKITTTIDRR